MTHLFIHLLFIIGVIIDLMHLKKPGGFDVGQFFCDIVSPPEDDSELGLQLQPCAKLEDLQKRVRAKEMKKRAQSRQVKLVSMDCSTASIIHVEVSVGLNLAVCVGHKFDLPRICSAVVSILYAKTLTKAQ